MWVVVPVGLVLPLQKYQFPRRTPWIGLSKVERVVPNALVRRQAKQAQGFMDRLRQYLIRNRRAIPD